MESLTLSGAIKAWLQRGFCIVRQNLMSWTLRMLSMHHAGTSTEVAVCSLLHVESHEVGASAKQTPIQGAL